MLQSGSAFFVSTEKLFCPFNEGALRPFAAS